MLPIEKRKATSMLSSPLRVKAARTQEGASPSAHHSRGDGEADSPATTAGQEEEASGGDEAAGCIPGDEPRAPPEGGGRPTPLGREGSPPAVAGPSGAASFLDCGSRPDAAGAPEMGAGQGPGPGWQKGDASDMEKDEGDRELVITIEEGENEIKRKRKKVLKRERKAKESKGSGPAGSECDIQMDDSFEQALEDGAKHHNLTVVNVRNILHEVITNEHVVAMMKAAIHDTEQQHIFEPKMTRSKLKEVVEKGVVPPTWNMSPMEKMNEPKAPQFIDIPLEEEDSSDEEYRPEEEEGDETAEESFLESDDESTSSSPAAGGRVRSALGVPEVSGMDEDPAPVEQPQPVEKAEVSGLAVRHLSVDVVPMGPPPLPPTMKPKANKDTSFMEKLHAVDEELASKDTSLDPYQCLEDSLIAYRTRSKLSLNNVSLGLLEAELKAPDITADMYDPGTQDDVCWHSWMQAIVNDLDYEDDEDDPEYNFLEDLDEPDMEDFRNDRAVRITKKEVNELMEELFETFQDEMGVPEVEEEGVEEDVQQQLHTTFNTPQALRFEEPLANLLTEQHRTVKAQIEQLRQRKARQQASATETKPTGMGSQQSETLHLDPAQRQQLQQQMQQHVQLLCQVHLLAAINENLQQEAEMTKIFLKELAGFAEKAREIHLAQGPDFSSTFSPCNLEEALRLTEEFERDVRPVVKPPPARQEAKVNRRFDESTYLPQEVAWIVSTRSVFMYPELLPHVALQPRQPKDKIWFTKGEDNLLVLGLKHFEGTDFPKPLISQYLMPPKTYHQLTVRIKNLSVSRAPDNVVKLFRKRKVVSLMPSPFAALLQGDMHPPIERGESRLPFWLQRSLPVIRRWMEQGAGGSEESGGGGAVNLPLLVPEGVGLLLKPRVSHLARRELRQHKRRPSASKPMLIHPVVKKALLKPPAPLLAPRHRLNQPAVPLPSPGPSLTVPGRRPRGRRAARGDGRGRKARAAIMPAPFPVPRAPVLLAVPAGVSLLRLGGGGCNVIPTTPAGHPLRLATVVVSSATFTCHLNHPSGQLLPVSGGGDPAPMAGGTPSSDPPKSGPVLGPRIEHSPVPASSCPEASPPLAGRSPVPTSSSPSPPLAGQSLNVEQAETELAAVRELSPAKMQPTAVKEPLLAETEPVTVREMSLTKGQPVKVRELSPAETEPVAVMELSPAEMEPIAVRELSPAEMEPVVVRELSPAEMEPVAMREPSPAETEPAVVREPSPPATPPAKGGELPGKPAEPPGVPESTSERRPLILDLGQELDVGASPEHPAEEEVPWKGQQGDEEGAPSPAKDRALCATGESPVSPTGGKSPVDKPDKAGQEEEEDEDFDDLTQDEDEEVLSSASEESALSVPELQETMEKLTWLASKRQLSQEGDSEEENSQEENSEPEEEDDGEGLEKEGRRAEEEMALTHIRGSSFPTEGQEIQAAGRLPGEEQKLSCRGQVGRRVRVRRGRRRESKDSSKLLLLYDEDILNNDPLRQQKDMAFAQAYLSKVREALRNVPGKYEEFLRVLYDFEMNPDQRTAVDLYGDLCDIVQDWPQLLKDFAAFLLPEQALQCGLFEEQQAFDKSRKFLRQLEICFAENPSQLQKIIKALQSCMVCSPPDVAELKVQVWQLLKGHHHLQDEFSLFFDQLRPPAGRMSDFEEVNWTDDKEYEFDGFEEVVLPDLEEEEELQKIAPPPRSKRRREGHSHEKGLDQKAKGKELASASVLEDWSPQMGPKDPGRTGDPAEEPLERGEDVAAGDREQRSGASAGGGEDSHSPASEGACSEGSPPPLREEAPQPPCGPIDTSSGRDSVKFASVGAQVRFRSCQEMALAHMALQEGCTQEAGQETARPLSVEEADTQEQQTQAAVCAKNSCVSSTGKRVVLWTREADRVILTACQENGANQETFCLVARRLNSKSAQEVSQRFRELMRLFHTSGDASTDEEEDSLCHSNPDEQVERLIWDEDQD
ncbi:GON-4-like protein isoform X2 [Narcine bancroftii]|uniref:GON-4-like protein isoform X2 n=1 Tax=Narcine bancroftii TaxID=1343680 RepID=UPI00383146A0